MPFDATPLFEASCARYQCPLCHKRMRFEKAGSFRCAKGHTFDVTKRGYVNFAPQQKATDYDKALFQSRRAVMAAGFYAPVAEAIAEWVRPHTQKHRPCHVLDVGCGEGYYARTLTALLHDKVQVYAIDLSKDAIHLAAAPACPVQWLVGNLANLPLQNRSMDVLLDLFTPANYDAFFRVMADDGLLIKAVPGTDYLREVREAAGDQLQSDTYDNTRVLQHFEEHARLVEQRTVRYERAVTPGEWAHFTGMTPMTRHVDRAGLAVSDKVTIHIELLLGRKKRLGPGRA